MYFSKLKKTCIALIAACMIALPGGAYAGQRPAQILRLHVIANSDSQADQSVKLKVRDAVLELVDKRDSAEEARAFVLSHGAALQQAAENVLRENGFDYPVQLYLGVSSFPDKSYGGVLFPAGEYEALRIVLGSGKGQNWWCVLFPPLCIVSREEDCSQNGTAQDGSDSGGEGGVRFHSSLLKWIRQWRDEQ